jgi:hypothetical protein
VSVSTIDAADRSPSKSTNASGSSSHPRRARNAQTFFAREKAPSASAKVHLQ